MTEADSARGWLRSLQVRTFPYTLLASMAGFLFAGGELFSPLAVGVALWSWISHSFLFGYDALLNELGGRVDAGGEPGFETLYKLVTLELLPWFGASVLLSYLGNGGVWCPLLSALGFLASAYVYHISSRFTALSFVPASLSVSLIAAFSFFAAGGVATRPFLLMMVSIFLAGLFWRSWSKGIESLEFEGLNFPEETGVKIDSGVLKVPRLGRVYADGLKAGFLFISGYAMFRSGLGTASAFSSKAFLGGMCWAVIVGFAVGFGDLVATSQRWSREKLIGWVSMEEFLTFLSLLALSTAASTSTGLVPLLVLGGVSFAWLATGNWLVHGISPVELPLKEALANFRNRIQGLTASERTGREIAQGIADRIAEDCGVPSPSVEMEDFKTSLTGRRGKFQPPDKIAVDGFFLGFVALSEERMWETLLAGTVAREFQKYLSFLGGAKAPVTAGMEEAELEETGWNKEELREVEEELTSSLEKVERRGSALEFGG